MRRAPQLVAGGLLALASCGGPSEAPRVDIPVVVDGTGAESVGTDLGYDVEVDSVRVAVEDIVFTVAGEVHTEGDGFSLIPSAHAHPGHSQGGEVTGELPGSFVIDWPADEGVELGVATMIATNYTAVDFTFGRGSMDELGGDDPLAGHTAVISGSATRDGETIVFTIIVDAPEGRELVGATFEADVHEDSGGPLRFAFTTVDALEGDTVFDGIDFEALDGDGDRNVVVVADDPEVEDAYNTFRRVFLTHDHYAMTLEE